MTARVRDRCNRWRSMTVAFRMSPEGNDHLNHLAHLSGMTKQDYRFTNRIADKLYTAAREGVSSLPKCTSTKMLICQSVDALNAVYDVLYQQ